MMEEHTHMQVEPIPA
jgi:hypothetical protein